MTKLLKFLGKVTDAYLAPGHAGERLRISASPVDLGEQSA